MLLLLMQELFSPFGPISRVYIAYDRDTGENRGFAFVNFVYRYAALLKLQACCLLILLNILALLCLAPLHVQPHFN